jgi:WD40 repeat protein
VNKKQTLLQGHCNQITATACSEDKKWLVTADTGEDSMLVVWDSTHGVPVRTYDNPHPNGIISMDLSADNQYIVTIGAEPDLQTISLWDWTNVNETGPIAAMVIKPTLAQSCPMHWIKFNPDKNQEIAMNSGRRIMFMSWKHDSSKFEYYSPSIVGADYSSKGTQAVKFTKTVFIPKSQMAVTGNDNGEILVFDRSLIIEGIGDADQKRLIKIVTLTSKTSIN